MHPRTARGAGDEHHSPTPRVPVRPASSLFAAAVAARDPRAVHRVGSPAAAAAAADDRVDGRAAATAATGRTSTADAPGAATFEASLSSKITTATPLLDGGAIRPTSGCREAAKDRVQGRGRTFGSAALLTPTSVPNNGRTTGDTPLSVTAASPGLLPDAPAAAGAPRLKTPAAAAVLPRASAAAPSPASTTSCAPLTTAGATALPAVAV